MARAAGGGSPVTIAVPAHWGPGSSVRCAARCAPSRAWRPTACPPTLIPDSGAALAGLRAAPGLPPDGVVVLCDFGASGTSITLADARAGLAIIGDTVRYHDFSGDLIDQALLNHVIAGIADARDSDPASTAAVGSLTRLRDECRQAKERLSADTAAVHPRRAARLHLGRPGDPARAGAAHRAAARGSGRRRRGIRCSATEFRSRASPRWRPSAAARRYRSSPRACRSGCGRRS